MTTTKKIVIGVGVLLALLSVITVQYEYIQKVKSERDKYQSNTYSLMTDIEQLRNDSTLQAYQIQSLSLTIDEYKAYRAEDTQIIKNLNLKLKNVTSISKQELTVTAPITASLVDTIIIRELEPVISQKVSMENDFIAFNGLIQNDTLTAQVEVPITLRQIVYKVPKHKFLWWSWGCKAIKQIITTDNPYVNLNYSEYVEIK